MLDGADHLRNIGVLVVVQETTCTWLVPLPRLMTMVWVASNREPKRMPTMSEETISSVL